MSGVFSHQGRKVVEYFPSLFFWESHIPQSTEGKADMYWHYTDMHSKKKKNQYFVFFLWNKPNYPPGEFKFKWGNKWQTSGGTWGNFSLKCCLGSLGKWAKPVPLTLIFHLQLNNSNQACRASNYFTHVEAAFMGLYCELLLSLPFRNQNTKSNIEGVAKPKKCAIRVGC